jgi:hypothetical protein
MAEKIDIAVGLDGLFAITTRAVALTHVRTVSVDAAACTYASTEVFFRRHLVVPVARAEQLKVRWPPVIPAGSSYDCCM